ncbi:hypothetical protein P154DRAFT_622282 [Amniculicola lignicola CBS 123094]|uniref:Ankyrin n=1 Tax=Amniculicola lignicola CBS 123094 TaxID=1392246 RepID=A0A6A5WJA4_9PLEO|nr:hypothetical protein P154DRAFT_622282 [Amniculicola lignicola CBS 123094]
MNDKRSLQQLVEDAGITPVFVRQPCLLAPTQSAVVASEGDHILARSLLVEHRKNNPEYKDPSKQLKRIFKTAKEKERQQDVTQWEFSQDEVDQVLSALIDKPTTTPGLVQAFLGLGAKVNFVEMSNEKKNKGIKKSDAVARRRSTILQRAATTRRADSVSLLASSGADQTTLDEGLKVSLMANDQLCTQELLRHGADLNKYPNALADAVRSNDQNLIRLFLRAPKALRPEIVSSCLPAAVQQKSASILSLLIGHGANPNFDGASAFQMAIVTAEYRIAVSIAAGPIPLTVPSLQAALEPTLKLPTAQQIRDFLRLLLSCGLPPDNPSLPGLLVTATKRNDTVIAQLLIDYGVPTSFNEAECLKNAISMKNWVLVDAILNTPLTPAHASSALAFLPLNESIPDRTRIIEKFVQRGASGPPLERWLVRAVEEGDSSLMDLLLNAGAPAESSNAKAIYVAVARKDMQSLRKLLASRPSPAALAKTFPLLRQSYTPSERLDTSRLLLAHGAYGAEVDTALIEAVSDISSMRDQVLIEELIRGRADANAENGKAVQLAALQGDIPVLQLLCRGKLSSHTTSLALPKAFGTGRSRHEKTLLVFGTLFVNPVEDVSALETLQIAINDGPQNLDIISRLIGANAKLSIPAFQYTTALADLHKKVAILENLLKMGIPQASLDEALISETRQALASNDTSVLQLLLAHGASVNYNDGESLSLAVGAASSAVTRLLLYGKEYPLRATTTKAFRALFQNFGRDNYPKRADISSELLNRGVEQPAIDYALRTVLDPANQNSDTESLVDLLLQHQANVNVADGVCFVFAAQMKAYSIFEKLLAHKADFGTIVPALIQAKLPESTLTTSLDLCFNHGCTSDHLERSGRGFLNRPSIVLAVQNYPRCESLIKLLLDHGCNPDSTTTDILEPAIGEETVPVLVWALSQPRKMTSSPVIITLLSAGASPTRTSSLSEISPIALAAREGRQDIVQELLNKGADPSIRDKWNRSALFFASSTSVASIAELLSAHALKDDGSLHEAARCLQLDIARTLVSQGHHPNFPSRLHHGRNALGELCLNADASNGAQRTKLRQLIRLFLDSGASAKFKARNEKSAVLLALDNVHNPLEVTEALLETELWEDLNDEKHMYHDPSGLWFSPIKYVELMPDHSRARQKKDLIELLQDKGCEPKYYSEHAEQPAGAVGMPAPIARLADRQKEHQLSLKLAKEVSEHTRMLEETSHRDVLRRKQEQQDAEMASAAIVQSQWQTLEQSKHEFEMQRVRSAERMKRSEKVAWHNLQLEQERDFASQRAQIDERKASMTYAQEEQLRMARQAELEHRAGLEKKALTEKEQMFERNVTRQKALTQRLDESAQLHARLRQDRPAIEGAQWGSVD